MSSWNHMTWPKHQMKRKSIYSYIAMMKMWIRFQRANNNTWLLKIIKSMRVRLMPPCVIHHPNFSKFFEKRKNKSKGEKATRRKMQCATVMFDYEEIFVQTFLFISLSISSRPALWAPRISNCLCIAQEEQMSMHVRVGHIFRSELTPLVELITYQVQV